MVPLASASGTSHWNLENFLILVYIKCETLSLAFGFQLLDRMLIRESFSYNLAIGGYVKCDKVSLAQELFDIMPSEVKSVISWNTMISGYLKLDNGLECARDLIDKMPERDLVAWNFMIDFCAKNGKMELAQVLFDRLRERDVMSWASMGMWLVPELFFDAMPQRDAISCNSMISGYANNGYYQEPLEVFRDILDTASHLAPDGVTLLTALSAASMSGCIDAGITIHQYMEEYGLFVSAKLGVALVDFYAKCGNIELAMRLFEGIQDKSIDHWNAITDGLAIHGHGDLAFHLFVQMERLSFKPDDITFIAVLHACGHSGMVKEGSVCFEIMRRFHKIEPKLQHYGCMVDILSRAGYVEQASNLANSAKRMYKSRKARHRRASCS